MARFSKRPVSPLDNEPESKRARGDIRPYVYDLDVLHLSPTHTPFTKESSFGKKGDPPVLTHVAVEIGATHPLITRSKVFVYEPNNGSADSPPYSPSSPSYAPSSPLSFEVDPIGEPPTPSASAIDMHLFLVLGGKHLMRVQLTLCRQSSVRSWADMTDKYIYVGAFPSPIRVSELESPHLIVYTLYCNQLLVNSHDRYSERVFGVEHAEQVMKSEDFLGDSSTPLDTLLLGGLLREMNQVAPLSNPFPQMPFHRIWHGVSTSRSLPLDFQPYAFVCTEWEILGKVVKPWAKARADKRGNRGARCRLWAQVPAQLLDSVLQFLRPCSAARLLERGL